MTVFEKTYKNIANANPDIDIDDFGTLYTNAFWKLQYELYKNTLKKDIMYPIIETANILN